MQSIRWAGVTAGGALALLGLTGCAAQAADGGTAAGGTADPPAAGASSAAPTSFTDGRYTQRGDYTSPGGASAVDVTLTLKSGVVTAMTVTPRAENPTAQSYESRFASGVNALTVGKKLTELNVTTVSGSSLTSQGFDKAIAAIEQRAAA